MLGSRLILERSAPKLIAVDENIDDKQALVREFHVRLVSE